MVFSLSSTRNCSEYIYTFCATGSEPWTLALWASCYIQIRTEALPPLNSGWDAGSPQLRAGTAMKGFPLHFQYMGKCNNSHCRCLILICCLCTRSEENHNFIAETGLYYRVMSPAPIQWSRPGEMQSCKQCALQWDALCSCSKFCELAKGSGGGYSCSLFLSRTQCKRGTHLQTLLSQLGRGIL